jgi:asparagine synthase (glutamine-hydrolysing)
MLGEDLGKEDSAESIAIDYRRYGSQLFSNINKHFTALIYFPFDRTLYIYRDKAGFQHSYYWSSKETLVFSTSLNWVLDICTERLSVAHNINQLGLAFYLTFQYLPCPYTMFENILQLMPGEQLHIQNGKSLEKSTYTIFPTIRPNEAPNKTLRKHAEAIHTITQRSTKRQIDANQKVAAFLSGGMDTSSIFALLVEDLNIRPMAFTATFTEESYNELEFARIVTEKYGLQHIDVPIRPQLIDYLPQITRLYENPLGDQSVFAEFWLCRAIKSNGFSQLVTGEGGDEILGYPRSRNGKANFNSCPFRSKDLAQFYLELTAVSSLETRQKMLRHLGINLNYGQSHLHMIYEQYSQYDPFERLYFGQWKTWLIDDVYMKDCSLARHFGTRLILPFMDIDLMQYTSALSLSAKRQGLCNKQILKTAMMEKLPDAILQKPKQKFWIPFREWFRGAWFNYLQGTLLKSKSFVGMHYGTNYIDQLITEHKSGIKDHYRILWALLFLEIWYWENAKKWV